MKNLSVKGKYFYSGKKPFYWLGDTAWQILDKLSEEEIITYLENRKSLGFNVIQTILVFGLTGYEGMPEGNKNIFEMEYWDFVDRILDYGERLGLYFALFPCWNVLVTNNHLNETNVDRFGDFLGKRFKKRKNIIWAIGGDIRGDYNPVLFNRLGEILKSYNPERLVTFHPFGRTGSYLWFNDCEWLDFNMYQSGHRRYDQLVIDNDDDDNEESFGESCYKYVIKNFKYKIQKPCLDAEPSYEGVVQGLHDLTQPYWEARHIRRYAYFSILEGACGFTYGNSAIIQCYNYGENGRYGVRESWKEALHSPGGSQLQYLIKLMNDYNFTKGSAHPEYIINQKNRTDRISCFASDDYIICYTYNGDEINLDLSRYSGKELKMYWMNPENDSKSYIGKIKDVNSYIFKPTKRNELSNDWILIIEVL